MATVAPSIADVAEPRAFTMTIKDVLTMIATAVVIVGGIIAGVSWVVDLKSDPVIEKVAENRKAIGDLEKQLMGIERQLVRIEAKLPGKTSQ